ncbi:hypothetical protein O181_064918 [Austropuccinia psidii MF-1]|uniref:CCHC-type domain-containing protein n=1 Tax=Austropuccinia psidii MF-1 TaxID=1389203 RepID=A0A9Q3I232_9BASI|nr:hypothetical protein [Austropuccinia psidii MF-1]
MCFEKFLRKIKTSNNDNSFGSKINEQSAIIKELTDKYSKLNIDDIIKKRIKQAIDIIKTDNKKVLGDILNSFTEVKTYTIALKKFFDASKEEVLKLSMKLNQLTADNTRQREIWQELTHKEDMYKIEVINLIQAFQHEYRNSQRCSNSKMNDIEQILNTLPRMSTPLNQNEGTRIPNTQVLDSDNSQLKNELSTSFHNLEPSMGQARLKEVPKLKEWPHFSGEGEYDHMEFIRGIDMIKEYFELPETLVTARFNNLFTRSAHRCYIKLRQAHGHQSWTWWKMKIMNKWANDSWIFKVETAFESSKFNVDKDKDLASFCQQKDRLTALKPDMSEFMIHRKILRQCGARFNTPWKDSVDKNPKENSNNVKYEPADSTRKCHICQSTTHLANKCPKRGKINEIDIEKEPDVEKDNNIEENSYDKSSIFSEPSSDIENINATFDIMESYSHLPQLSNGQLDLSKIQYAQIMKTKPNRGKGYTAGNSCITEVVINNKPTKILLDPGVFCSCVGKSFLKTCVPNFEDHLLPIDGIKFNSASNPMKALGIFEMNIIFPHIDGNLGITVKFVVMENCSSTHFILGNDFMIMYGIELHNKKDRYFTIGDNKHQKFAFLPFKRKIKENELSALLYDDRGAFASDKEHLGAIIVHEADIILNIERTYPTILRRPAYPASPKSREALEIHIKEPLHLGVIRKVGHNEEVEITTPVIVAWNNGTSKMVGEFRALNTYTVPERYLKKYIYPLWMPLKDLIRMW